MRKTPYRAKGKQTRTNDPAGKKQTYKGGGVPQTCVERFMKMLLLLLLLLLLLCLPLHFAYCCTPFACYPDVFFFQKLSNTAELLLRC